MKRRAVTWLSFAAAIGATAILGASCKGSTSYALSVDLRTDLAPGVEFVRVVTDVDGAKTTEHAATEAASDYVAGTRVADFGDLGEGSPLVKVALVAPDGAELVARLSRVALKKDYALTVVVTRSCAGVTCPVPAGDPEATTCVAGQCAKPDCTPDTPESCPAAECASEAQCRTENKCLVPSCSGGVCLFSPNDGLCEKGATCHATDGCVDANAPTCVKTADTEANCGDGRDDDCDGRVDCIDEDCQGKACEDGDACTTGETCEANACKGGSAVTCDDGNACTDDSCDPKSGCAHANNTAPCDDLDACTDGDTCKDGACAPGKAVACDDQDPCTDDVCDATKGCVHAPNVAPCEDGDACTVGDVCANGACVPGKAAACDDQNPCTDDACDKKTGCTHAPNAASCDDGVFCNGLDVCSGGSCAVHPGSPCANFCDENSKACVGCQKDADCGGPTATDWSACGGFADACATQGTQSRTVTTPSCKAGQCVSSQSTETQACARVTDGSVCGAVVTGAWSACGGFASRCATDGTQTRSVTTPTCAAGVCGNVASTEAQACSRTTNGVSCGATVYGGWSACGGFASACDTTGTQSRTVTTYACAAGACAATKSTGTQSCTRTVAAGTSCGGNNYCCGGSCVAKSSTSHCGSCGIVCGNGHSCSNPVSGEWGCKCSSNAECVSDGYGTGATCYTTGVGSFCNCQCANGAASCTNRCSGGATCHDVSGQNYCSYP
jgi:hypothetical protein